MRVAKTPLAGPMTLAIGTVRPRNADGGPSTAFNLCASEREYSYETARSLLDPRGIHNDACHGARELEIDRKRLEAIAAPGSRRSATKRSALTGGPLHTRSVRSTAKGQPPRRRKRFHRQDRQDRQDCCLTTNKIMFDRRAPSAIITGNCPALRNISIAHTLRFTHKTSWRSLRSWR